MSTIYDSLTIRNLTIKNRLEMPSMATRSCENGFVTEKTLDFYKEKTACGGVGLVMTEHHYISVEGMADPNQVSIAEDDKIEGLSKEAAVIHQNGSKVIVQISHAGSRSSEKFTGLRPISASGIVHPGRTDDEVAVEMTKEEIDRIVKAFTDAAVRAKKAGFDGVEIHSAHSYLLNQFMSPLSNFRTDEYGGSLENRYRIHVEVTKSIREAVGDDFVIAIRFGGCDFKEGGNTVEDAVEAAKILSEAGIDLFDCSGGMGGYTNPEDKTEGYYREYTKKIREATGKPVVLTGGIVSPEEAKRHIAEGYADMVGVGRAILKDSNWSAFLT